MWSYIDLIGLGENSYQTTLRRVGHPGPVPSLRNTPSVVGGCKRVGLRVEVLR